MAASLEVCLKENAKAISTPFMFLRPFQLQPAAHACAVSPRSSPSSHTMLTMRYLPHKHTHAQDTDSIVNSLQFGIGVALHFVMGAMYLLV